MKFSGTFLTIVTCVSLVRGGLPFVPSAVVFGPRVDANRAAQTSRRYTRTSSSSTRGRQHVLQATSNWFAKFLAKSIVAEKGGKNPKVAALKRQLLDTVRATQRGVATSVEQRQDIDALIAALEPVNPNANAVTSESLSALWILEWTTEREILFLMEKGLLGLPSGEVQQAIDVDAGTLSNTMLFGPDSVFEVASSIEPEVEGPRVNFEFEACKLRYRGFTVPLPPVGKGWFESVYLDEDFRVTRDVRGDVTVLVKSQD